jgi:tetratricopeptide (TPR) repeat protein
LEARIAQLEGRWEAAIDALRSLEQRGLLGSQGREELARLLLLVGQRSEAERLLQTTPQQAGNINLQRLKLQAEIWAQQGEFDRVKQVLGPIIEKSSDALDWLWWAQLLSSSRYTEEADQAFEKAQQLAPHAPQIALAQIIYLARTARDSEARKRLEKLADSLKKDAPSLRVLALGYEAVGDIRQAEQCFRQAMAEAPRDADLLLDWAGFALRHGEIRQCQVALERIIAASANNLVVSEETLRNARRNLAQLLAKSADYRDFVRGRSLLEANLKQASQVSDRCLLARILANRPERTAKQEAADMYQRLLREGVILSAEDRFVYAQILAALGRWPDARLQMAALFQQTSEPTPTQLAFFIREMLAHESPGEEIRPYLEKLEAQLGSDSPVVLELKMRLAVQAGNTKDIEARWRTLVSKAIEDRKYDQVIQLAEMAERAGMTSLTSEALEQVATTYPEALIAKALFLARQKQLDAALDCCQQALAHVPIGRVVVCAVNCLRTARELVTQGHLARVDAWFQQASVNFRADKGIVLAYTSFLNLSGRYEELIPLYRQLLTDSRLSDLEKALLENNLAYILSAQHDLPAKGEAPHSETEAVLREAEQLVEHAITVLGPIGSFLDTRAVVRMRQGRLAEAISDARQAVLEEPSPLNYFHLVECLWFSGDKATALREFQRGRANYHLSEESLPPIERPRLRRLVAELKELGLSLN